MSVIGPLVGEGEELSSFTELFFMLLSSGPEEELCVARGRVSFTIRSWSNKRH